nr:reverse transcriptase domain-containing protein [Tanacetum cinerariifolium]
MARMDDTTIKIDAQYKDFQSRSKQPKLDDNDIPMSCEEEAKFMQTFCRTPFYNDYRLSDFIKAQHLTNSFVKDTFMDLKNKLETTTKTYQASIQNLEAKFDRFADKQSGRPSGSLPSNTQPNPKGSSLKPYQPPQAQIKHVNTISTQSGFSCNALANLDASINLIPYSLYAKLPLETLKPTKMSIRLADQSFQYPVGIAENILVEVDKFTFPVDFVILEMEEVNKVPLILGRPFLHTADAVNRVKHKQLNLVVRTERMIFNIDYAMKHSYSNDDTCFSIDEILEEDFDAFLDEGRKILHYIEGTILKEKLFAQYDKFMPMTTDENYESEYDTEEPPFKKITFNTDYKIKISLKEHLTDLELKHLPDNLEYVFLEEPSF